jgi:hypothetical protein
MADLTALCDAGHFWGGDLLLSPTGDLARVTGADRSKQRVIRRLMTNPGDYIWHPTYGAGLPRRIGTLANPAEIKGVILAQLALEASVAKSPAPQVTVSTFVNGISVKIVYVALPDRQPVPLSFDVSV